ncbi:MAG: hypothetical protein R3Y22_03890 [Bacteroidales bacterium]
MKQTIRLVVVAVIAVMTFACNNATKNNKASSSEAVEVAILNVEGVMESADSLIGKEIEIEGVCSHLCAHGASKMFLVGDSLTLRIESGELGSFSQDCINNIVTVKGTVKEDRVDEAYLQSWEAQLAKQVKEVHGEDENGCSTEKAARNEVGNTPEERIAGFRARIAERAEKEGKEYLSFYHIVATSYEVQ